MSVEWWWEWCYSYEEKTLYIHEQIRLWKIHSAEMYSITYWRLQQKIQCSHCEVLLEHSQIKNTEITVISHHLKSENCSKFNQNQKNICTMILDSEMNSSSILILIDIEYYLSDYLL